MGRSTLQSLQRAQAGRHSARNLRKYGEASDLRITTPYRGRQSLPAMAHFCVSNTNCWGRSKHSAMASSTGRIVVAMGRTGGANE